jgi:hypothetical protein
MHDELHQFTLNDVWTLVPRPTEHNIIGTKWIFKNKTDEGVNFDETFAPVAKLESIRILQDCISERYSSRRGLCRTAERISRSSTSPSCVQAEESSIWT